MTWTAKELREMGVPECVVALRIWRKRHGVAQRELALSVGITASEMSAIETGRIRLTLAMAEKIREGCRRVGPPNSELGEFDEEVSRLRLVAEQEPAQP